MLDGLKRWLPAWLHVLVPGALMLLAAWPKVLEMRDFEPPSLVQGLQFKLLDRLQRESPREYDPEAPVRIVDIDDASLAKVGQWPWPRTVVARLVRRLSELGAKVVAFDALFAEPDRTSPRNWAALLPDSPAARPLREAARSLPDHDAVLAKAFADSGRVVAGFVVTGESNALRPAGSASVVSINCEASRMLGLSYRGVTPNLPALESAAAGKGNFTLGFDADGVIRRVPLLFRVGEDIYPLLSLEALRVARGARTISVKCAGSGRTGHWAVENVRIEAPGCATCAIPTDQMGRLWMHFTRREDDAKRLIPAWRVLEKGFDPEGVRGRIVFVGTSAAGLRDLRTTPMNSDAAGVDVHAQVVEQILKGSFLRRPLLAPLAELGYTLLLGAALILLLARAGAAWSAVLAACAIAAAFGASWAAFTRGGWVLDPVIPSAAVLAVYLSSSLIGYLRVEARARKTREQFVRYMSPELVEQLALHPEKLALGGEMREMTLMFTDIRGFTAIAEKFDPQGLTQLINRYLTPMTDILLKGGAFIDKYMGDAIMAFWNAPVDEPEHARRACRTALEMNRRLAELNVEWRRQAEVEGRAFVAIRSGIGLNTGRCCVGNMGSDQRFEYSVLGDDVNLASRLEGQSKSYGVDILLGQNTRQMAPGFATLELDRVKVKGKTVPVTVYALLGDEAEARSAAFAALSARNAEFLAAYRGKRWGEAQRLALECRGMDPRLEKLYDLHASRIDAYRREPPPLDWDGSFTATEK